MKIFFFAFNSERDGFKTDVETVEREKEVGVNAKPLVAEAKARRKERDDDLVNMVLFLLGVVFQLLSKEWRKIFDFL